MEKTEFALESFKNTQELIKFVEQKSGAVLIITGLIFTGYIEFLKDLEFSSSYNFFSIVTFVFSIITALSLIIVVYISIFKVLKPRFAKNYQENEFSLLYYKHVCKIGKDEIYDKYKDLTDKKVLKDIISQKFEISKILEEKTNKLGVSFNYLFVSIFSLIVFIISSFQA